MSKIKQTKFSAKDSVASPYARPAKSPKDDSLELDHFLSGLNSEQVMPDAPKTDFPNAAILDYEKWPSFFFITKEKCLALACPFCYVCDPTTYVELAKPDAAQKRLNYTCELKDHENKYRHPRIFITRKFVETFRKEFFVQHTNPNQTKKQYMQALTSFATNLRHINFYCDKCNSITLDYSSQYNASGGESAWRGHFHYRCSCKKEPKLIGIISAKSQFKNKLIPLEVQQFASQLIHNYPKVYAEDIKEVTEISKSFKPVFKKTLEDTLNMADAGDDDNESDQNYDNTNDLVIDEDAK